MDSTVARGGCFCCCCCQDVFRVLGNLRDTMDVLKFIMGLNMIQVKQDAGKQDKSLTEIRSLS